MHQETDTGIRHKSGAKNELFQFSRNSLYRIIDIKCICNYILQDLLKLKIYEEMFRYKPRSIVLHCKYGKCNMSTTFSAWLLEGYLCS